MVDDKKKPDEEDEPGGFIYSKSSGDKQEKHKGFGAAFNMAKDMGGSFVRAAFNKDTRKAMMDTLVHPNVPHNRVAIKIPDVPKADEIVRQISKLLQEVVAENVSDCVVSVHRSDSGSGVSRECIIAGADVGHIVPDIMDALGKVKLPAGSYAEVQGQRIDLTLP